MKGTKDFTRAIMISIFGLALLASQCWAYGGSGDETLLAPSGNVTMGEGVDPSLNGSGSAIKGGPINLLGNESGPGTTVNKTGTAQSPDAATLKDNNQPLLAPAGQSNVTL